jgi:exonuclease SbcC
MRPIKLKIRGLNSFIEEQVIDFEKLTERGLFGIFGPTGSGKSTVLDGITLALYGEVARKSTNYINTNCDSLSISYEFQISGAKVKRYRVDREFKRDKKSQNPISGKCKIIDITDDSQVVLADKVRDVTERCKSIIGLSLEDFTRTVMLPQGQFSEFLKLEGKNRREMLERLFNLQQYGDDLTNKLLREISKNRVKNNQLIGEMKGYEDISTDRLKLLEEELETICVAYTEDLKQFEKLQKDYQEANELWNLTQEFNQYKNQRAILIEQEQEINNKKSTALIAQAALNVNPIIIAYEDTLKQIDSTKLEEDKLRKYLDILKIEKNKAELAWKEVSKKKDTELPDLKVKEDRAKEALKEKELLVSIENEIKKIKDTIKILNERSQKDDEKLAVVLNKIQTVTVTIKSTEEKITNLNVESRLKEQVSRGIILTEKQTDLDLKKAENKNKEIQLQNQINQNIEIKNSTEEKFNSNSKILNNKREELNELISKCPGNQNDIIELQRTYSKYEEKWNKFNKLNLDKEAFEKKIAEINISLADLKLKKEAALKSAEIKRTLLKKQEILHLSNILREELNDGQPCPVCGSTEHINIAKEDSRTEDIKLISDEIAIIEEEIKKFQNQIVVCETNIKTANEGINHCSLEIIDLGEDFKNKKLDELKSEFDSFISGLKEYESKKNTLEEEVLKLKETIIKLEGELSKINAIISQSQNQINQIKEENTKLNQIFLENHEELKRLIQDSGVSDFIKKNNKIINMERQSEALLIELKQLRNESEELNKNKEEFQLAIKTISERLAKGEALLSEKESARLEKVSSIKSKVEQEQDIELLIKSLSEQILELEALYESELKNKEKVDKDYQEVNEKLISITTKYSELINRERIEKERLEAALKEEKFIDIQQVKENILSREEIEKITKEVDQYKNLVAKVNGAIESLNIKINNRNISEEEFIAIKNQKDEKETKIEETNKAKIKKEEELKVVQTKLSEFDELIKVKDKLEHKLALLSDLEKLFKGKRFVEFVAITRLKYISKEASKRLMDISTGNYGLETDENGRFIIRDYKNGGIARDSSTLSGGETFLASLALALALSAEIQLKGTAPLELFFLDEGFGTLDDNLLEIVMSSLERVHNERLKVGIISHVESIKNRVPVKLLVTPAEAGMGGSKVRIEKS